MRIKAFGMPNGKNEGIVMSGDLAFNFNPDKVERYIKYFPDIKSEKEFLEQFHLEEYHNLKQNRILIPVTGGLNNYKNSLSGKLDRFDFYVCLVDKIIKEKEVKTKEGISIEWSEILVKFLSQYTIEEFCSNLLLITCENYRKELLNLGAQELNTQENILKYIALAHGYWEMCGDENYKYRYNGKYNNYWNNL